MLDQFISPLVRQPGSGLQGLRSDQLQSRVRSATAAAPAQRREELKKAAQEFESLFVSYLLKVMRETIEESGLTEGGLGKGIYMDLFDQEMSRTIGRRGFLGISDLLLKSLPEGKVAPEIGTLPPPDDPSPKTGSQSDGNQEPQQYGYPGAVKDTGEEIPDFHLPVQAPVSSLFGPRRDPFTREIRFHKGLDLAAPEGTPVRAAVGGKVTYAGHENGYGNTVIIEHAGGLQTRYAHLGKVQIKPGETITRDQVLGAVGNSGHSTGPHLHFEVIRWGERIDPTLTLAD